MGLFRRRRNRSIDSRIAAAQDARLSSQALAVDELPITQGLVQLHADLISSLDLRAVDRRTGAPVLSQPALLVEPDPTEDREDTIHKMVQALWWGGNAPTSIAPAGPLTTLHVLNPLTVGWVPDALDDTVVRYWLIDGVPTSIDRVKNWKMNDDPRKGPLGRSPFVAASQALDLYGWAYRYLLDYFAQGGNPSLVLRSNRPLATTPVAEDTATVKRTEAQIAQDAWVGARQAYRPAVLDPQWTLEQGPAPQDLEQTIAVLQFAAQEVGRLTNVPPSIANLVAGGSLTYSTTSEELRRWLLLGLGPTWLRRIERGFTRLLGDPRIEAQFDQDSLTRFDVLENAARTASPIVRAA
jgi:hypothetical protein